MWSSIWIYWFGYVYRPIYGFVNQIHTILSTKLRGNRTMTTSANVSVFVYGVIVDLWMMAQQQVIHVILVHRHTHTYIHSHTCVARHSPNAIVRWLWIQAIVCEWVPSTIIKNASRATKSQTQNLRFTFCHLKHVGWTEQWSVCRLPAASPRRQWKNDDFGNKIIANIHWWSCVLTVERARIYVANTNETGACKYSFRSFCSCVHCARCSQAMYTVHGARSVVLFSVYARVSNRAHTHFAYTDKSVTIGRRNRKQKTYFEQMQ